MLVTAPGSYIYFKCYLFSNICIHERHSLVLTYLWSWCHLWCDRIGQPHQYHLSFLHPLPHPQTSHLSQVPLAIWRQKDQRDLTTLQKAIFPLLKAALYNTYIWLGLNCTNICTLWVFSVKKKTITFDKMKEWWFLVLLFCSSGDCERDIGAIN